MLWNLTGRAAKCACHRCNGNASRTMLMDLETLDWDDGLLSLFSIPRAMPVASSAPTEPYGVTLATGPVGGGADLSSR